MTTLAIHSDVRPLIRPEPRSPISIREAISRGGHDLEFIDALQKKHSKQVGWMSSTWLESNIRQGNILIAQDEEEGSIGYCLYKDKYLKHEDLGICYQLNVAPNKQRGLVGAALIKAAFERCPYGVKLFCCWCAQDIEANHFWESIGFVPLAFRAGSRGTAQGGSRKEGRIHIFWQRRIREGDEGPGATPYWYPTETTGGSLRENRIVLPIPPGTHWSDAKPMVVPGMEKFGGAALPEGEPAPKPKREKKPKPLIPASVSKIVRSGLRFGPIPTPPTPKAEKPKREKQKNDPKLVAAAREFRDRYLDEVNSGRHMLEANGKYDVSRQLAAAPLAPEPIALLNAA
jgi:hypothetical protein